MNRKLLLLIIVWPVICSAGEKVDVVKAAAPDGMVRIINIRGQVVIKGWDRNEIAVRGELDDLTEEWIFNVNGQKSIIEVKLPRRNVNWGDGSDLEIYVPEHSKVDFKGVSTEVSIENVLGGVRLKSVSGDIKANGVFDQLMVTTVSGEIEVEDCEATLHVTTVSGEIDIKKHKGSVIVESISGDIEVDVESVAKIMGRSVSGTIDMEVNLLKAARLEIESVSGDIKLELMGEVNATLKLEAGLGGEIENDLTDDEVEKAFMGHERLNAKVGDGESQIIIRTVSADIQIE